LLKIVLFKLTHKVPGRLSLFGSLLVVLFQVSHPVNAQSIVADGAISWPDNGWYQVQSVDGNQSICEGGRTCAVTTGTYIVINHTTGERWENIAVQAQVSSPPSSESVTGPTVSGNVLNWTDDGWSQVQDASDYTSICEGGISCMVESGT
jgi:hypothetical protein